MIEAGCVKATELNAVGRENLGLPITNADRIRSISDEELAKKLAWRAECPDKAHQDKCNEDCFGCWLDWLRREVKHGGADNGC